ncbi:metal-dependent hydrolase [Herbiconiux sp. P17]|uniref:metal-dependent hydrolase n=1 Tax=Herbiconiux wuyangfengii TaxID=3342794 RepID=UPI0035BA7C04
MALPRVDTVVTYPSGAEVSSGVVLHVEPLGDGRVAVLLDETSCHPVDAAWPDQGADRATLTVDGQAFDVVDCVVGATDGASLFLGAAVPVRPGAAGWAFVVAHVLDAGVVAGAAGALAEGATARVEVDAAYRRALSAGHTACHLASLALNDALAGAWTKDAARDGRGNPNFDQLAIESSTIEPNASLDVYRVGKSLRKKGFAPAVLTEGEGLTALAAAVDGRLAEWGASGARVEVQHDGDDRGLSGRRTWTCHLPGGAVSIPCGGTHLTSLAEFASIRVTFDLAEQPGALELRMRTTATLAPVAPPAPSAATAG